MDIAECTLNGERYHAARFARLAPKRLAELRQHLRCPDELCGAKAQFRKASKDGRAACFIAPHTEQCTIEQEFPSLGRVKKSRARRVAAPVVPAAAEVPATPADGDGAERDMASEAQTSRRSGRGRARGLGNAAPLNEAAQAAAESEAVIVPVIVNPVSELTVHVATPTAVTRAARHDPFDPYPPMPLVPAVIDISLSATHEPGTVDPLDYWRERCDGAEVGAPRFDLTSLASRLAADPSVATLTSIVMAPGFSGYELREFLASTDHPRGLAAYWGTVEQGQPAGGGLYLTSGEMALLLTAEVVAGAAERELGLSADPESWLGITFVTVATPVSSGGAPTLSVAEPDAIGLARAEERAAQHAAVS